MITPLSWLERVPTYKEQIENLKGRDLGTYGFLAIRCSNPQTSSSTARQVKTCWCR